VSTSDLSTGGHSSARAFAATATDRLMSLLTTRAHIDTGAGGTNASPRRAIFIGFSSGDLDPDRDRIIYRRRGLALFASTPLDRSMRRTSHPVFAL